MVHRQLVRSNQFQKFSSEDFGGHWRKIVKITQLFAEFDGLVEYFSDNIKVSVVKAEDKHKEIHCKSRVNLSIGGLVLARSFSAVIDRGADICLIRKGLVPPGNLLKAQRPVKLMEANVHRLKGWDVETLVNLVISGLDQNVCKATRFKDSHRVLRSRYARGYYSIL